jgi:hypothetical protein
LVCAVSVPVIVAWVIIAPSPATPETSAPLPPIAAAVEAPVFEPEPEPDCVAVVELDEPVEFVEGSASEAEVSAEPGQPDDPCESAPVSRDCDRCKLAMCHVPGRWACHACGITLLDAATANGQQGLLPQCPHEMTR